MTNTLFKKLVLTAALSGFTMGANAWDSESEVLAIFDPASDGIPEAITSDYRGNIYTGMAFGNQVAKFNADGDALATYALPVDPGAFTTGLVTDWDQNVFVAVNFGNGSDKGIWKISKSGEIEKYADFDPDSFGFLNGLAIDRRGSLYVTDSALGKIYKVDEDGAFNVWYENDSLVGDGTTLGFDAGANGIAFNRSQRALFVTNLDKGTIQKIRVKRDGTAGRVREIANDPLLKGADGITVGPKGKIYAAINIQNTIVKVSPGSGRVKIVEQDGNLHFPADVVFGKGDDTFSLYIANFSALPPNTLPALLKIDNSKPCYKKRR